MEENMELWKVRGQSLAALEGNLKREYELLEECLALIKKYIKRFRQYAINDQIHKELAAVCFHLLIRVHHLAHGVLSLALDGLMLESFSLLRTLVEGAQMIV